MTLRWQAGSPPTHTRARQRCLDVSDTWVERTGDGRRWCLTFYGKPYVAGGHLVTWETADGARAHAERLARAERGVG